MWVTWSILERLSPDIKSSISSRMLLTFHLFQVLIAEKQWKKYLQRPEIHQNSILKYGRHRKDLDTRESLVMQQIP